MKALKPAIQYFEEATKEDPLYAKAYSGIAHSYLLLSKSPREVTVPLARAAALKALAIDSTIEDAHSALAVIKYQNDWDYMGAERELIKNC